MSVSDLLFARPSFWEGVARVLDLGGTLNIYNESKTPEEADRTALQSDFAMVGKDINKAMKIFEEE